MSNNTNDTLFERAAEMIDYFEGTLTAKLIEQALEDDDLEKLHHYVVRAEGEVAMQEYYNDAN